MVLKSQIISCWMHRVRMCHLTFIYFVSQAPLKGSVASFFASVKESDKTKCEV